MSKVPNKKVTEISNGPKHTRHEYVQLECVVEGFFKVVKGDEDRTKLYTTLVCRICGEPKEVIAATNLMPKFTEAEMQMPEVVDDEDTEPGEEKEV